MGKETFITAKIRRTDHVSAVEIADQLKQAIGIYISDAIKEKNEREQEHLAWLEGVKQKEAYRSKYR